MRKLLRCVSLAVALTALPNLAAAADLPADTTQLRSALGKRLPGVRIGEIRPLPYNDLYEVVANGFNVFYTNSKGDIALMGELIDFSTGRNLSRERVAQLRTIDFATLPLDKAIVKVKGNGSRRLALFSDPDCPHCQQLERELSAVTDVTIYTFLLPIPSIHPDATRKSELVWCAEDRARAWDELMLAGREPSGVARCETPIRDIAQLADKLHIAGTPGIVFGNGRLVPGGISRNEIEKLLNDPSPSAAKAP